VAEKSNFSLLDYGCGYGAMLVFLKTQYADFQYLGLDISEEMIAQAIKNHVPDANVSWKTNLAEGEQCDYTIASGIFNVRLGTGDEEWKKYILDTLDNINKHTNKGFSFNMLTSYSDKEYMRDYLYYADPAFFFDYCKRNFSKYVAVMHDYPLYEFTIIVRKA
jgi:SAM-dependent methyltransferase